MINNFFKILKIVKIIYEKDFSKDIRRKQKKKEKKNKKKLTTIA